LELSLEKHIDDKMQLKSAHLQKFNLAEFIDKKSGIAVLNILKNNGIKVINFTSNVGLFLANQLQSTFTLISMNAKKTFVYQNENNVMQKKIIEKGFLDCISYVKHKTLQKYPYVEKKAILLIIQNFIHFSEIEMIQKLQRMHTNSHEMASANYEVMNFVAHRLKAYLLQMFENYTFKSNVYLHTEEDFAESFVKVLSIVLENKCFVAEGELMVENQRRNIFMQCIKNFLEIFNFSKH
jgi:hypothetical protein